MRFNEFSSKSQVNENSGGYDKAYNLGKEHALAGKKRSAPWPKEYPYDLLLKAYNLGYKEWRQKPAKPSPVAEGKFTVNAKTGAKLDPRTGAELPPKERPAKIWTKTPPAQKSSVPSSDEIWRKVESVVSQIYPDGDPYDYLPKWLMSKGVQRDRVSDLLSKAAKANGFKDVYDYYEHFGDDLGLGESTDVTNYNPKSQGGTRKELLAKYAKSKSSADATAARKAGATQRELQNAGKVAEDASGGASCSASVAAGPAGSLFAPTQKRAKDVGEGVGDAIKRGVKSVKRGMQGWGQNNLAITGDANKPRDIINRTKGYDDEAIRRLHKGITGKDKHTPAGLQKRVADREMTKRGLK